MSASKKLSSRPSIEGSYDKLKGVYKHIYYVNLILGAAKLLEEVAPDILRGKIRMPKKEEPNEADSKSLSQHVAPNIGQNMIALIRGQATVMWTERNQLRQDIAESEIITAGTGIVEDKNGRTLSPIEIQDALDSFKHLTQDASRHKIISALNLRSLYFKIFGKYKECCKRC